MSQKLPADYPYISLARIGSHDPPLAAKEVEKTELDSFDWLVPVIHLP